MRFRHTRYDGDSTGRIGATHGPRHFFLNQSDA